MPPTRSFATQTKAESPPEGPEADLLGAGVLAAGVVASAVVFQEDLGIEEWVPGPP